jgi:hypothetical protein
MRSNLDRPTRGYGGLTQLFGLDPRIAILTLLVDAMLFGGELLTMGLLIPVAIVVGIGLGVITYRAQRSWYGDDRESALIKAAVVALLTAIPTPLPAILSIPSAVLGALHYLRRGVARLNFKDRT